MGNKSFTLMELIAVIIIIGVLATLGLPQYATMRERTIRQEADANLLLIFAAERIFNMENGGYYPLTGGTESTLANINNNLKLFLSATNWNYSVETAVGPPTTFTAAYADRTTTSGAYNDCKRGVRRNATTGEAELFTDSGTCPP